MPEILVDRMMIRATLIRLHKKRFFSLVPHPELQGFYIILNIHIIQQKVQKNLLHSSRSLMLK